MAAWLSQQCSDAESSILFSLFSRYKRPHARCNTKKAHTNIFIVVVYLLRLQFFLIQVLVYSHTCRANLLQTKMVNGRITSFQHFHLWSICCIISLIHHASLDTFNKASKKENKCPLQVTRSNQIIVKEKKMPKTNLPKIGYFNWVDNKRL